MTREKILRRVLSGVSDTNIQFDDLCHLFSSLGFAMRVRGSHHIFRKAGIEEKLNLQREGSEAKWWYGCRYYNVYAAHQDWLAYTRC